MEAPASKLMPAGRAFNQVPAWSQWKGFSFCLSIYFSIEANYLSVDVNNRGVEAVLTQ